MILWIALQFDGLRSDDPAERDRAEAALRELPTSRAAEIRAAEAVEKDPEAKVRLRSAWSRLLLRESDALYRKGKLVDSLKKRVEAWGVEDVEGEFARRTASVAEAMRELMAPVLGCELQAARQEETVAFVRRLGRWTYPALLEGVRKPATRWMAIQTFWAAGADAYPALREALREAEPDYASGLLEIFLAQKAWAELESLAVDPALSETARSHAARALLRRP